MSEPSTTHDPTLPVALALRVDAVCLRFEVDWKSGPRPRIEDYLGHDPGLDHRALLHELIPLDVECRRRHGEAPRLEDYAGRFPDLDAAWLAEVVAGPVAAGADRPPARPATLPPPIAGRAYSVRCPHCHNPIHLVDDRPDEVLCPACGSSFRVQDTRATDTVSPMRRLGKFQLLERVGLGAFGAVWKARDIELDRVVALKIPHAGLLTNAEAAERFYREARAAAHLRHPGIVTVHEVATLGGLPAIVADFVEGVTLRDFLHVRRLTFRESAELVAQVADALDYAHTRGLVHRDVKPANVILEYGPQRPAGALGKPLLLDFGLALRAEAEVTVTLDGQVVGTPAYMSPEQAAGRRHGVDRRSDVYSLGVVLYELLCGELPFRGTKQLILHQVQHEDPRPPRRLNEKIPRDLQTVCLKCLEKEPARRYASAAELARDLRRFLANEPIIARPAGPWERTVKWVRRRPAQAALLLLSALSLLAGLGVAVSAAYNRELRQSRDNEEAERQRAERALEQAEQYLYFNRIGLADRSWWDSNVERARELLAQCPEGRRRWEWYYLDRLCHAELLALTGHTDEVLSSAVSPDGKLLASGSKDRTVRLWDTATGRELRVLRGHTAEVWGVTFSRDGSKLVSATGTPGTPGEVKLWSVSIRPGQDVPQVEERWHLDGHTGSICQVAFSPDGQRLAVASGLLTDKPGRVYVLGAADRRELLALSTAQAGAFGLAFSPDGNQLLALGSDARAGVARISGDLYVWDAGSGKELRRVPLNCGQVVNGVVYSPDGRYLATAGEGGTIKLWEASTFKEVRALRGHRGDVNSLAFEPNGQRLASVADSDGGVVRIWDVESGEEVATLRGHTADVYAVAFLPGGRLVSGGMDRLLRVWDATTDQEARTLRDHAGKVAGVALSRDGRWLASGGHDRTVRLWDRQHGGPARILGRHTDAVWAVAFSAQSTRLASAGGDWQNLGQLGEIRVWDVRSGQELLRRRAHTGLVWTVAFSPDGTRLATGGGEFDVADSVKVWDADTGRQLFELPQRKGVKAVVFSPDGQRLAGVLPNALTAKVWDAAAGKELLRIDQAGSRPVSVAFSPDGQRLLTGNSDQSVRVWDAATGQPLGVLRGHTSDVMDLAFSGDGHRLATAGYDQKVKLWDVTTGQELLTLRGHRGAVWKVVFSTDGRYLASCADDGTVKLWDASPRR